MSISDLADEVFDALQAFDQLIAPHGLYAAGDLAGEEPGRGHSWKINHYYPEWQGALKPVLEEKNGGINLSFSSSGSGLVFLPAFGQTRLDVRRLSKIKVRQYGSKYHLDKHELFDERWDKLAMDKAIANLWASNERNIKLRLLLFIGFDKAGRPFERELGELKPHQTRASHGIEFFERAWDDPAGRGFKVKAALWAHQAQIGN